MRLKIVIWLFLLLNVSFPQVPSPPGWKLVENRECFFDQKPVITVKKTNLVISWETEIPTSLARIHYGIVSPDATIETPDYRYSRSEKGKDTTWEKEHRVVLKLDRLLRNERESVSSEDGFTLYYRIESWVADWKKPLYWDDRVHLFYDGNSLLKSVTISEGPFIDCVFDNSAIISWSTDEPAKAVLSLKGNLLTQTYDFEAPKVHFEQKLKKIKPDREYSYRIRIIDSSGREYSTREWTFRSEREKTDSFKFTVLSDARGAPGGGMNSNFGANYEILQRLRDFCIKEKVDFVIFGGDLISGFSNDPEALREQYLSWKRLLEPLSQFIPVYEIPGNHEMSNYLFVQKEDNDKKLYVNRKGTESTEALFSEQFVNPDNGPSFEGKGMPPYGETAYYFRYNNSLFVAVNTFYNISTNPEVVEGNIQGKIMIQQLRWLEKALKQAREDGVEHIFVIGHHPGFPNGGHTGDSMWWGNFRKDINQMRNRFWGILSKYHVDAYFCGHEHNYNRMKVDQEMSPEVIEPVYQIVTGRAGAPYYNQDTSVPWADKVEKFSTKNHLILVEVKGTTVNIKAIDEKGDVFDEFLIRK